jgi:hypothetical protein
LVQIRIKNPINKPFEGKEEFSPGKNRKFSNENGKTMYNKPKRLKLITIKGFLLTLNNSPIKTTNISGIISKRYFILQISHKNKITII